MADVTISSLTQIPTLVGTASLPITDGTTTYRTTITQLTSYNLPIIVATGGTETTITERGIRYRIHTFTTAGITSLNITTAINNPSVELLLVGGGGGGGGHLGGGGGAGGVYYNTGIQAVVGTTIVSVGSGGIGGGTATYVPTSVGENGGLSRFGIYSVPGGGRGGTYYNNNTFYQDGANGGCGGGGGSSSSTYFPLPGYGLRGTNNVLGENGGQGGYDSWGYAGGGGGGAGACGASAAYYISGDGGAGILSNITGINKYYAGGGGGNMYHTSGTGQILGGNGGSGGGGDGGSTRYPYGTYTAKNGIDGLGGGGGGGTQINGLGQGGGRGGSGIVIVRYPIY